MNKKRLGRSSTLPEENLINLTPLIDVVFVVLIAFILVAPLLEVDHVNLASASYNTEKDIAGKNTLSIYVREDDSIWLNNQPISLSDLTMMLKEKKHKNIDQVPQIFHDKKASFGTYQNIKNAVEVAGFDQMDVILQGQG
jgi:biopolymer transport protein ExbD